jgi:hypothetical protein
VVQAPAHKQHLQLSETVPMLVSSRPRLQYAAVQIPGRTPRQMFAAVEILARSPQRRLFAVVQAPGSRLRQRTFVPVPIPALSLLRVRSEAHLHPGEPNQVLRSIVLLHLTIPPGVTSAHLPVQEAEEPQQQALPPVAAIQLPDPLRRPEVLHLPVTTDPDKVLLYVYREEGASISSALFSFTII